MTSFNLLVSLFIVFALNINAMPFEKRQAPAACDANACLTALQAPVLGLASSLEGTAEACLASATASPTAVLGCLSGPLSSTLTVPAACSACSTVTPNIPLGLAARQDAPAPATGGLPLVGSLPLGSLGSLLPLSTIEGLLGSLTAGGSLLGGTTSTSG